MNTTAPWGRRCPTASRRLSAMHRAQRPGHQPGVRLINQLEQVSSFPQAVVLVTATTALEAFDGVYWCVCLCTWNRNHYPHGRPIPLCKLLGDFRLLSGVGLFFCLPQPQIPPWLNQTFMSGSPSLIALEHLHIDSA